MAKWAKSWHKRTGEGEGKVIRGINSVRGASIKSIAAQKSMWEVWVCAAARVWPAVFGEKRMQAGAASRGGRSHWTQNDVAP